VKDALVVPVSSVITAPDGTSAVMLAGSDGRAHQKTVKLGIRNGDDVQILDGVNDGDKVVATGAYGLPDKTKIKIEAAEPAEGAAEGSKAGEGSKDSADSKDNAGSKENTGSKESAGSKDKGSSKAASGGSDDK
jgi:hypothetical protein